MCRQIIILEIMWDPERTDEPDCWDWDRVLDMAPGEHVTVVYASEPISEPGED